VSNTLKICDGGTLSSPIGDQDEGYLNDTVHQVSQLGHAVPPLQTIVLSGERGVRCTYKLRIVGVYRDVRSLRLFAMISIGRYDFRQLTVGQGRNWCMVPREQQ
jgi:hypothetical protein